MHPQPVIARAVKQFTEADTVERGFQSRVEGCTGSKALAAGVRVSARSTKEILSLGLKPVPFWRALRGARSPALPFLPRFESQRRCEQKITVLSQSGGNSATALVFPEQNKAPLPTGMGLRFFTTYLLPRQHHRGNLLGLHHIVDGLHVLVADLVPLRQQRS